MTGCTVRRYDQLETFPETIEQELQPAENYSIDVCRWDVPVAFSLVLDRLVSHDLFTRLHRHLRLPSLQLLLLPDGTSPSITIQYNTIHHLFTRLHRHLGLPSLQLLLLPGTSATITIHTTHTIQYSHYPLSNTTANSFFSLVERPHKSLTIQYNITETYANVSTLNTKYTNLPWSPNKAPWGIFNTLTASCFWGWACLRPAFLLKVAYFWTTVIINWPNQTIIALYQHNGEHFFFLTVYNIMQCEHM